MRILDLKYNGERVVMGFHGLDHIPLISAPSLVSEVPGVTDMVERVIPDEEYRSL